MADSDQIIQVQTWIDSALLQWERRTTEQEVAIGLATRSVLDAAWTSESRNSQLAIAGIRSVCKTFSSDSEASAKLLRRAFDPNHLKQFGHEELRWMVQPFPISRFRIQPLWRNCTLLHSDGKSQRKTHLHDKKPDIRHAIGQAPRLSNGALGTGAKIP